MLWFTSASTISSTIVTTTARHRNASIASARTSSSIRHGRRRYARQQARPLHSTKRRRMKYRVCRASCCRTSTRRSPKASSSSVTTRCAGTHIMARIARGLHIRQHHQSVRVQRRICSIRMVMPSNSACASAPMRVSVRTRTLRSSAAFRAGATSIRHRVSRRARGLTKHVLSRQP